MAVTAAEVDVILRAKDQMTPAVNNAKQQVKGLADTTVGASKSMASAYKTMAAAGALTAVTAGAIAFGKASLESAMKAERLGAATENLAKRIGSSQVAMVNAIQAASQGTVSQLAALEAANKAMMFGVIQSEDEMAELTKIAVTLGRAMGVDASKSVDDLTTALGRNSKMILDNLGINLDVAEANRVYAEALGKTVEQLTDEEKKIAFRNAALIEGRALMEELGGITGDSIGSTEQLGAAWADFNVEFGKFIVGGTAGASILTDIVKQATEGAKSWQWMTEVTIGAAKSILGLAKAEDTATDAASARASVLYTALIPAEYSLAQAMLNTEQAIISRTGAMTQEMARYIPFAQARADAAVTAANEEKLAAVETAMAVAQAVENQILSYQTLQTAYADYVIGIQTAQENLKTGQASTAASIAAAEASANERRAAAGVSLTEALVQNEQGRADAIHRVMEGAHARSAEQNAADLKWWNDIYDQKEADLRAAYDKQNTAIDEKLGERRATLAAAAAEDAVAEEKAMNDLKLLAALTIKETAGELVQFTGGMANSAAEAAKLIEAGVLPVTETMATDLGRTISGLDVQATTMTRTQGENAKTMAGVFSGEFAKTTTLAEAMGATGFTTGTKVATGFDAAKAAADTLATSYDTVVTAFTDTINKMPEIVSAIKWEEVGASILLGIKKGVESERDALLEAIRVTAMEAYRVMMEAIEGQSPSKLFAKVGQSISEGVAMGIRDAAHGMTEAGEDILTGAFFEWFNFFKMTLPGFRGKTHSAFKDWIRDVLEDFTATGATTMAQVTSQIFNQLVAEMSGIPGRLGLAAKQMAGQKQMLMGLLGGAAGTTMGELVNKAGEYMSAAGVFGGLGGTAASLLEQRQLAPQREKIRLLEEQLALLKEQGASLAEQAKVSAILTAERKDLKATETDLAALARQQADLQFLQQQSNLITMIREQGLNAKQILGGLKLGLGADLQGIIQAMTRAMQEMIKAAEKELGIASESKVFAKMGRQALAGFGLGAMQGAPGAAGAVQGAIGQTIINYNYPIHPTVYRNQGSMSVTDEIRLEQMLRPGA